MNDSKRRTPVFAWAVDRALPALATAASAPRQADDPNVSAQYAAVRAIGIIGRANPKLAAAALVRRAGDTPSLRIQRIDSLSELADASDDVFPILLKEFKGSGEMRLRAVYGFRRLGPKAAAATEAVMEAFRAQNKLQDPLTIGMARDAIQTLAAIAPDDERVAKLLLEVLADRDTPTALRLAAGSGLSQMSKPAAKSALPVVEQWPRTGELLVVEVTPSEVVWAIHYRLALPDD